jgi:hypothetical protein
MRGNLFPQAFSSVTLNVVSKALLMELLKVNSLIDSKNLRDH